ncbi:MAG: UTP--glucose-1-phosphate uridylyltransferase, partial [Pseudomonadota bacterium]
LDQAKSLIPVRKGKCFLQITTEQLKRVHKRYGVRTPLMLMNSFRTREDSLALLTNEYEQPNGLPLDFLQHKVPRIDRESNLPSNFADTNQNWAPPGHGDVYLALFLSGQLEMLVQRGFRWAFVSNADNLAATVDPCLLGFLEQEGIEFAMEVTDKTLSDVKGGTLVRYKGKLTLLERTQVEEEHLSDFEDLGSFTVFNTNSVWWRLDSMLKRLKQGSLDLPMIVNPKRVDNVSLVQLETAMAAAIGCFDHAIGLRVTRHRFAPVKGTSDLLAVRSDAFFEDENGAICPSPSREQNLGPPVIRLEEKYYGALKDFESRFPYPLGLSQCSNFKVEGDFCFGRNIEVVGDVILRNTFTKQQFVPDGTCFTGETVFAKD